MSLTDASNKDLKPLSRIRPVAALPFAARYRAIDFALSNFSHAGIESVAMFIGGSGRSIYDHIRSGSAWDLESGLRGGIFTYSQTYLKQRMSDEGFDESDFYVNQREFLKKSRSEYVVVTGGKVIANIDILDVREFHVSHDADMTLLYKNVSADRVKNHPYERIVKLDRDGDVVELMASEDWDFNGNEVAQNVNVYFLTVKKMLDLLDRATKEGIQMDVDRLLAYYSQFYNVKGYEFKGAMVNIDSMQAYYDANINLLDKDHFDKVFHNEHKVITKGKNEAPTYYSKNANVKKSLFASGAFVDGTVENSLIFRKVKIEKDAVVKYSIIMQGAKIGAGAVLEYCILDKDVTVEPGAVVKGTKDKLVIIEKNEVVPAAVSR